MYGYEWKPYVPVAVRRQKARRKMETLRKKGVDIQPIEIQGRKIAKKFWGEAWCDHIESFNDFENRLPRGRTYVRNGSVCHLAIKKGSIKAKVSGSDIYNIEVDIKTLPTKKWSAVKQRCAGQIGSLLELLRGSLSDHVMQVVTDREAGLFPLADEISFECDCPDWATMCKHVAAVLYGVGARLDQDPALLFLLRGVEHDELIDLDAQVDVSSAAGRSSTKRLASGDLGDVFGIDLAADAAVEPSQSKRSVKKKTKAKSKATRKKSVTKKKAAPKKKPAVKKKPTARKTAAQKAKPPKKTAKKKKTTVKKKAPVKKRSAAKKKVPAKRAAKKVAPRKKKAKSTAGKSTVPMSKKSR